MSEQNDIDYRNSDREIFYRCSDVAQILNISRSKAYQLVQTGEIPSVRIGTSVRVRPVDLRGFINAHLSGSQVLSH